MFANKKNEKKLNDISTLIGEETTFKGTLEVNSSIRIDGLIQGDVICQGDVTIGQSGHVDNELTARNLYIAGKVEGNVKVQEKIHIYDTGSLKGLAEMSTIIIEENGQFHGESVMNGQTQPTPVKTKEKEEKVSQIDKKQTTSENK
ncbi:bactofilin family protein [Salipaludibacillus daqingensis]|uniref:bactofilin family protein n=1 Tax=Salipaludibacillus daqingensis TaxID=3041001 RepID=UPI002474CE91|nr:polymer-forming cytoskeletal protein [Salipaludibacillus daqingensis]